MQIREYAKGLLPEEFNSSRCWRPCGADVQLLEWISRLSGAIFAKLVGSFHVTVSFKRSDGLGSVLSTEFELDSLPVEQGKEILRALQAAEFFLLPEKLTPANPEPERCQYTVTVAVMRLNHTVTRSEGQSEAFDRIIAALWAAVCAEGGKPN
jgi:hypothetical protein